MLGESFLLASNEFLSTLFGLESSSSSWLLSSLRSSQAKVANFDLAVVVDEEVGWLNVSVDNVG